VIWLIKFAMRAMMPRTDKLPGIEDTDLDGFLRKLRKESDALYWTGLVLGSFIFAITPLITLGLPVPAFFLSKKLLDKHADKIMSHPAYMIRQGVYLVRLSAGMCWGADPKVRALFEMKPYPSDPGSFRTS
jgi:hypothetical protein